MPSASSAHEKAGLQKINLQPLLPRILLAEVTRLDRHCCCVWCFICHAARHPPLPPPGFFCLPADHNNGRRQHLRGPSVSQQRLADSLGDLGSLGVVLVQVLLHLLAGLLPLLAQACGTAPASGAGPQLCLPGWPTDMF